MNKVFPRCAQPEGDLLHLDMWLSKGERVKARAEDSTRGPLGHSYCTCLHVERERRHGIALIIGRQHMMSQWQGVRIVHVCVSSGQARQGAHTLESTNHRLPIVASH